MEADQPVTDPWAASDPTDVIGRRGGAKVIDTLISSAIGLVPLIAIITSFQSHTVNDATNYCEFARSASHACLPFGPNTVWEFNRFTPLWYLVSIGWWLLIALLEGLYGWTPGKAAFGLRVVRATTGRPCGFGRAVIRNLVWIVDGCFFGIIAVVIANKSPGHQRLGDRAADTLVVDRSAAGFPPPPWLTESTAVGGYPYPQVPIHPMPPVPQPTWDPGRNAYIVWSPSEGAWLQYDEPTQQWHRINN